MRIAVVMSGFPRRSETFGLNELLALRDAGALAAVFATKPGDGTSHPGVERLAGLLHVLPDGTVEAQATQVAAVLAGTQVDAIHAYFAHHPAAVAERAAALVGVPWGFSTHALDARKVDGAELARRARAARTVIACNHDVAAELTDVGAEVTLLPHGVDLDRFTATAVPSPNGTLAVLAVGRLVEKKGFPVLLDAVAAAGAPIALTIVGEGPLHDELVRAASAAGLDGRVRFAGPATHGELPAAYAAAAVVAVPSIVNGAGDRDGLPNVVLEAMASGRAVVASDVGAVASAVTDGASGLLVPPGDAAALAAALDRLAGDPALRAHLGRGGRERVLRDFSLAACTTRFVAHLEGVYA